MRSPFSLGDESIDFDAGVLKNCERTANGY